MELLRCKKCGKSIVNYNWDQFGRKYCKDCQEKIEKEKK